MKGRGVDRLDESESKETRWDAAIVGAGPAGGVAAAILARRGWKVLLLEKSNWPRDKVCGGCLNAAAVGLLSGLGLESVLSNAQTVDRLAWHVGKRRLQIPLPRGVAMLRSDLDRAIVAGAVDRGCTFMPGITTTLAPAEGGAPFRELTLRGAGSSQTIRAGVVLACDGIGGTLLAGESWARWDIVRNGWMGISTTCKGWPGGLAADTIHMHVGPGGYVGLVKLPDARVHLAAALDPRCCREAGGPAQLAKVILRSCGVAAPAGLENNKFRGTGTLTRRRSQLGGHRVLAVGDACGYVEPFTGEGMAWAIAGSRRVVDLLPAPGAHWPENLPDRWRRCHAAEIRRGQRWCIACKPMMHHPTLAAAGLTVGWMLPTVGRFVAGRVCGGGVDQKTLGSTVPVAQGVAQ